MSEKAKFFNLLLKFYYLRKFFKAS